MSGHFEKELFGVITEKFSFTAHTLGNGSTGGRFVVSDVFNDGTETIRVRGDVICFRVLPNGQTAAMGGIVTGSNDESFIGTYAIWTVRDLGEGANSPPDLATDLGYGYSERATRMNCGLSPYPPDYPPYTGFVTENLRANIQVRP